MLRKETLLCSRKQHFALLKQFLPPLREKALAHWRQSCTDSRAFLPLQAVSHMALRKNDKQAYSQQSDDVVL
jgi:hypothetical protein